VALLLREGRRKGGREGKGKEGKGKGEEKGRDPQGLVDTPCYGLTEVFGANSP